MIIKFPKPRQKVEVNPFKNCELFDLTLSDFDEIYNFIVDLNSIYINLPKKQQEKDIYLNFNYADKCIFASYKQEYLAVKQPINDLLGFVWEELYGEDEEEATYNALYSSVDYLIGLK